jgi:pyruvate formate lyase activating enzyme
VQRDWYKVLSCRIEARGDARGACPHCGTQVAGRFGAFTGGFGRRRIPVQMAVHWPLASVARSSSQGDDRWT